MPSDNIHIVAARRTPLGAFQGTLRAATAIDLSAAANRAVIADLGSEAGDIDEVLMGCVLPAGLGQAPARQAALAAGLPLAVPCSTLNKVCGSGMKTVMLAADLLRAGGVRAVLAGGMESMSNAPYLSPKARDGYRMGHQQVLDHMFYDGLQSPFDGQMMGHFAELTARKYDFTREAQDKFAIESVRRAKEAIESGAFDAEIVPVTVSDRRGSREVSADETPLQVNVEKIPTLKPAFAKDGTVTAASSSSISDGAASLVLMHADESASRGLDPLAVLIGQSSYAQEPEWFTTSPVYAVKSLLDKLGLAADDIDLYEINEAFACVTMAAMQDVGLPHEKVNVHGGACALGHPIGASGARILVTLIHALLQAGRRSRHRIAVHWRRRSGGRGG